MSLLFLANTFSGWSILSKGVSQTSELRGGKYAARVQEGFEKDGSPKYRYFKTQEEYQQYLSGSGKKSKKKKKGKDDDKEHLDEKLKEERKESKRHQRVLFTEGKKKKIEVETTKKSFRLYIEVPQ